MKNWSRIEGVVSNYLGIEIDYPLREGWDGELCQHQGREPVDQLGIFLVVLLAPSSETRERERKTLDNDTFTLFLRYTNNTTASHYYTARHWAQKQPAQTAACQRDRPKRRSIFSPMEVVVVIYRWLFNVEWAELWLSVRVNTNILLLLARYFILM